jgi:hypothetical protein
MARQQSGDGRIPGCGRRLVSRPAALLRRPVRAERAGPTYLLMIEYNTTALKAGMLKN